MLSMKKNDWLITIFAAILLSLTGCGEDTGQSHQMKTDGFEPLHVGGFTPVKTEGFAPLQVSGFPPLRLQGFSHLLLQGFPGPLGKAGLAMAQEKGLVNIDGTPTLERIFSYHQPNNKTHSALLCAKKFLLDQTCLLEEIKPLGIAQVGDLSLADIEKRLVVSHDWMAESFLDALREINDQDLLNMFKPVNSIVLSYEVQPSFYHPNTASIYLDPRYIWRSGAEWETIHQLQPAGNSSSGASQDLHSGMNAEQTGLLMDYRGEFQREFMTKAMSRYVDNSGHLVARLRLWSTNSKDREAAEVAPPLYRLLAHELAHANDYLPPVRLAALGDQGSIYNPVLGTVSNELKSRFPLTSDLLLEAAKIAFHGAPVTDRVRQMTGTDAGREFDLDGASRFYGYSTPAEDLATIFADFMMYKRYGILTDVAFVRKPSSENVDCNEWKIEWGQRARLAEKNVRDKAQQIAKLLLDWDIGAQLPPKAKAPIALQVGSGWCESLHTTATY